MVPEILPWHKAVCHAEYIMLKECEKWHVWKGLSDTPSPEFIRCFYMRALSSPKRKQCGESEQTGLAKLPLPLIVGLGANSPFFPALLYIVHSSSNLALKTL